MQNPALDEFAALVAHFTGTTPEPEPTAEEPIQTEAEAEPTPSPAPQETPAPVEEPAPAADTQQAAPIEAEEAAPVGAEAEPAEPAAPANPFHRHVARAWFGLMTEEACPCPKAPCGLVDEPNADPECHQHHPDYARTMRQAHHPDRCPGPRATTLPAPVEPQDTPAPAPEPEPEVWHFGRGDRGDVYMEDRCRCTKEPCGLVDPTRADPLCEQHARTAARTMRQRHRASECPGHRPYPRKVTQAQQLDYIREQLGELRRREDWLNRRLAQARDARTAAEGWLHAVLTQPEAATGLAVPQGVAEQFARHFGLQSQALFNLPSFLSGWEMGALAEVLDALGAHEAAEAWRASAPPTKND